MSDNLFAQVEQFIEDGENQKPSYADEFRSGVEAISRMKPAAGLAWDALWADTPEKQEKLRKDTEFHQLQRQISQPQSGSEIDIFEPKSLGDIARFGMQSLGQLVEIIPGVIVPAATINLLGGPTLAAASTAALTMPLSVGEMWQSFIDEGMGTREHIGRALTTASAVSLLDAGGIIGSLRSAFSRTARKEVTEEHVKKTLLANMGTRTGKILLAEMPTEATQEMLMLATIRAAKGLPAFDFEVDEWKQIGQAGFSAVAMAGTMGPLGTLADVATGGVSLPTPFVRTGEGQPGDPRPSGDGEPSERGYSIADTEEAFQEAFDYYTENFPDEYVSHRKVGGRWIVGLKEEVEQQAANLDQGLYQNTLNAVGRAAGSVADLMRRAHTDAVDRRRQQVSEADQETSTQEQPAQNQPSSSDNLFSEEVDAEIDRRAAEESAINADRQVVIDEDLETGERIIRSEPRADAASIPKNLQDLDGALNTITTAIEEFPDEPYFLARYGDGQYEVRRGIPSHGARTRHIKNNQTGDRIEVVNVQPGERLTSAADQAAARAETQSSGLDFAAMENLGGEQELDSGVSYLGAPTVTNRLSHSTEAEDVQGLKSKKQAERIVKQLNEQRSGYKYEIVEQDDNTNLIKRTRIKDEEFDKAIPHSAIDNQIDIALSRATKDHAFEIQIEDPQSRKKVTLQLHAPALLRIGQLITGNWAASYRAIGNNFLVGLAELIEREGLDVNTRNLNKALHTSKATVRIIRGGKHISVKQAVNAQRSQAGLNELYQQAIKGGTFSITGENNIEAVEVEMQAKQEQAANATTVEEFNEILDEGGKTIDVTGGTLNPTAVYKIGRLLNRDSRQTSIGIGKDFLAGLQYVLHRRAEPYDPDVVKESIKNTDAEILVSKDNSLDVKQAVLDYAKWINAQRNTQAKDKFKRQATTRLEALERAQEHKEALIHLEAEEKELAAAQKTIDTLQERSVKVGDRVETDDLSFADIESDPEELMLHSVTREQQDQYHELGFIQQHPFYGPDRFSGETEAEQYQRPGDDIEEFAGRPTVDPAGATESDLKRNVRDKPNIERPKVEEARTSITLRALQKVGITVKLSSGRVSTIGQDIGSAWSDIANSMAKALNLQNNVILVGNEGLAQLLDKGFISKELYRRITNPENGVAWTIDSISQNERTPDELLVAKAMHHHRVRKNTPLSQIEDLEQVSLDVALRRAKEALETEERAYESANTARNIKELEAVINSTNDALDALGFGPETKVKPAALIKAIQDVRSYRRNSADTENIEQSVADIEKLIKESKESIPTAEGAVPVIYLNSDQLRTAGGFDINSSGGASSSAAHPLFALAHEMGHVLLHSMRKNLPETLQTRLRKEHKKQVLKLAEHYGKSPGEIQQLYPLKEWWADQFAIYTLDNLFNENRGRVERSQLFPPWMKRVFNKIYDGLQKVFSGMMSLFHPTNAKRTQADIINTRLDAFYPDIRNPKVKVDPEIFTRALSPEFEQFIRSVIARQEGRYRDSLLVKGANADKTLRVSPEFNDPIGLVRKYFTEEPLFESDVGNREPQTAHDNTRLPATNKAATTLPPKVQAIQDALNKDKYPEALDCSGKACYAVAAKINNKLKKLGVKLSAEQGIGTVQKDKNGKLIKDANKFSADDGPYAKGDHEVVFFVLDGEVYIADIIQQDYMIYNTTGTVRLKEGVTVDDLKVKIIPFTDYAATYGHNFVRNIDLATKKAVKPDSQTANRTKITNILKDNPVKYFSQFIPSFKRLKAHYSSSELKNPVLKKKAAHFAESLNYIEEQRKREPQADLPEGRVVKNRTPQTAVDALPSRTSGKPTYTFAGVGSRNIPKEAFDLLRAIGRDLTDRGYRVNTGDAKGADSAFSGLKRSRVFTAKDATDTTRKIAEEVHPNWKALTSQYARNLMARNTNQVFGGALKTPVDFVVAYTPDGATTTTTQKTGGTGQAIRLATRKGIPVINIANKDGSIKPWQQVSEEIETAQKDLKEGNIREPQADPISITTLRRDMQLQRVRVAGGLSAVAEEVKEQFAKGDVWTRIMHSLDSQMRELIPTRVNPQLSRAVREIADQFAVESGKKVSRAQQENGTWESNVRRELARWRKRLDALLEQFSEAEIQTAFSDLHRLNHNDGTKVGELRKFLDDYGNWVRAQQLEMRFDKMSDISPGIPEDFVEAMLRADNSLLYLRNNFVPHVWNTYTLESTQGRQRFEELMDQYVQPYYRPIIQQANTAANVAIDWPQMRNYIYAQLTNTQVITEATAEENDVLGNAFNHAKARILDIPTQELIDAGLIQTDIRSVLPTYIRSGVRAVEWDRMFGGWMVNGPIENARPAFMGTLGNVRRGQAPEFEGRKYHWSSGAVHERMANRIENEASVEQAVRYKQLVEAHLGRIGENISPKLRLWQDIALAVANTIFLPLVVFASIPDISGMLSRTDEGDATTQLGKYRNQMEQLYRGMRDAMKEMYDKGEAYEIATAMGIIAQQGLQNALLDTTDSSMAGAVSPFHAKVMAFNEKFFDWNQMNRWTRFTRLAAYNMAVDTINSNIEQMLSNTDSTKAAVERLKDIGVDTEAWIRWNQNGRPLSGEDFKLAQGAVDRFVNQAVARPQAAVRPAWMGDPRFRIISYLKQFMWIFKKTFLDRIINKMQQQGMSWKDTARTASLLMTTMGTAFLGLAARDTIYYAFSDKDPDRDFWDWLSRSGLLGPFTLVMDMTGGYGGTGQSIINASAGPIIGSGLELLTSPIDTAPRMIPFAGINTNLRNW